VERTDQILESISRPCGLRTCGS